MHRPIGVTLLAIGAGVAALFEIWRTLVFLGIVNWTFLGKEVSFKEAQWGSALWAILLAAIWIWVAEGFWNVRAYAWSFGIFISLFTMIFGFFAILAGSTTEAESFGDPAVRRDLLLPELPGRPGAVRAEGDVAPDPRAARQPSSRCRPPRRRWPPRPPPRRPLRLRPRPLRRLRAAPPAPPAS